MQINFDCALPSIKKKNYIVIDHWQPIYASYEHQSEWTTFDIHKWIGEKRNDEFERLDLNHNKSWRRKNVDTLIGYATYSNVHMNQRIKKFCWVWEFYYCAWKYQERHNLNYFQVRFNNVLLSLPVPFVDNIHFIFFYIYFLNLLDEELVSYFFHIATKHFKVVTFFPVFYN